MFDFIAKLLAGARTRSPSEDGDLARQGEAPPARGKLDATEDGLRRALAKDPNDIVACVGLGAALCEGQRHEEAEPLLRRPTEGEDIVADYAHTGLTLRRHPIAVLRDQLNARGFVDSARLRSLTSGSNVRTAGLVITRQRPGSAEGVTFVTLEDEHGSINLIVWRDVAERQRQALIGSRLLGLAGKLQREGEVMHVIAHRLVDLSRWLGRLRSASRDFH